MKKILLILVVIYFAFPSAAYSQSKFSPYVITETYIESAFTDTILLQLTALDLSIYKNKPVDTFLTKIPAGYVSMKILSPGNPKYAEVLSVVYPNRVFAWIYVYDFTHMNPKSETMTWDMTLFRKENVHHINIYKGPDCVNGCLSVE